MEGTTWFQGALQRQQVNLNTRFLVIEKPIVGSKQHNIG